MDVFVHVRTRKKTYKHNYSASLNWMQISLCSIIRQAAAHMRIYLMIKTVASMLIVLVSIEGKLSGSIFTLFNANRLNRIKNA